MNRSTEYSRVHFSAEVIRKAIGLLWGTDQPKEAFLYLSVETGNSNWNYDNEEEFFSDYQSFTGTAHLEKSYEGKALKVRRSTNYTEVSVKAEDRTIIQAVFNIFDESVERSRLPEEPKQPEPKPTVFIGHGRAPLWRDLIDHLHHQHNYPVEAYETGARAGHTIRDVIDHMLRGSSFAVLVMTGEDQTAEGTIRARQNVIHETGLFQGRLGFSRTIVLLEDGTEEFSNIHGVQQIRFSKGNIRETFGDVLATLRREFPSSSD